MGNETILFDDGMHKCIMFSFDDEEHEDRYLSVNQYLIIHNDAAVLIDPGSSVAYDEIYEAVERLIGVDKLKFIFFSHQDPDVAGSIAQWSVSTNAKIVLSGLWSRFMSHYGLLNMDRITALPDKGAKINLGSNALIFLPAHFLHSPGNFSLYDSRSKILFSGDIGAAVLEPWNTYKEVSDFPTHEPFLRGFHERYMAGNKFTRAWVQRVRAYPIEMIAPQHGAVFKESNVEKFLHWFEELACGGDLIENLY